MLKLNHCLTDVKCCFRNACKCTRCIIRHFELLNAVLLPKLFSSYQALDCSVWSDLPEKFSDGRGQTLC